MRLFLSVFFALGLSGCATLQGEPTNTISLTELEDDLKRDRYKRAKAYLLYAGLNTPAERRLYRDEVFSVHRAAADARYSNFIKAISSQKKWTNSLLGTGALYLNALASITTGGTSSAFVQGSSFLQGSQGILGRELFYESTLPVLISVMDAERARVMTRIEAKRSLERSAAREAITATPPNPPVYEYGLAEALSDLEDYKQAGSIERAVSVLLRQTAVTAQEAEKDLQEETVGANVLTATERAEDELAAPRVAAEEEEEEEEQEEEEEEA